MLGMLLFSAPEYHLADLRTQIYQATKVHVALRFRNINEQSTEKTADREPVKAIHLEVDVEETKINWKRIFDLFSSKTKAFPSGIKMRMVAEVQALTSSKARFKAGKLKDLQTQFLLQSETSLLRALPQAAYNRRYTHSTLKKFLLTNPQQSKPAYHLFYAISPLVKTEGFIIRYLPQHSFRAREVLAQLQSIIPGIQGRASVVSTTTAPSTRSANQTAPQSKTDRQCNLSSPNSGYTECSIIRNSKATSLICCPGPQAVLEKLFRLQFNKPFCPSQILTHHNSRPDARCQPRSTAISISNHNLHRWLQAIWQLFQNNTWDWWRYRNGIF